MKKLLMVIPLVFLLCFSFSYQKAEEVVEEPAVDIAAETEAVKEVFWVASNAIAAKNAELMASTFADDVISFRGDKEAILEWFKNRFSKGLYSNNYSILKIELSASGDMGYVAFRCDFVREKEGEAEVTGKGYNVTVLKKQADGTWKQVAF
jgi:ketosteroid isomerase-like protein